MVATPSETGMSLTPNLNECSGLSVSKLISLGRESLRLKEEKKWFSYSDDEVVTKELCLIKIDQ
jgi:hypothetical protein